MYSTDVRNSVVSEILNIQWDKDNFNLIFLYEEVNLDFLFFNQLIKLCKIK